MKQGNVQRIRLTAIGPGATEFAVGDRVGTTHRTFGTTYHGLARLVRGRQVRGRIVLVPRSGS